MRDQRFVLFLLIAAVAAITDQALKRMMTDLLADGAQIAITSFAGFRLAYNTGISFGIFAEMFQHSPWVLVGMKLAITVVITLLAWHSRKRIELVAYGLIAGGAVGNLLDRARIGAVVDYVDVMLGRWHFPVFNAADCLLAIGVGLLIWATVGLGRRHPA